MMFKMRVSTILIISFVLISSSVFSQKKAAQVKAEIVINKNTEYIELKGKTVSFAEGIQSLKYVFSVFKTDSISGNISKNKQEGLFVLESFGTKIVSSTTVNQEEKEKVVVVLLVYDQNERLMAKDRWAINEGISDDKKIVAIDSLKSVNIGGVPLKKILKKGVSKSSNDTTPVSQKSSFNASKSSNLSFSGIITEDTKTKPGRDYYKIFSSEYLYQSINAPEIISVTEQLAQGRNTKIEVKYGDEPIHQFFLQPKEDYLEEMARNTIIFLKRRMYFLDKQKRDLTGN